MRKEKVFNPPKKADDWNELDESLIQDLSPHNQELLRRDKYKNIDSKEAVMKDKEKGIKYYQSCKQRLNEKR